MLPTPPPAADCVLSKMPFTGFRQPSSFALLESDLTLGLPVPKPTNLLLLHNKAAENVLLNDQNGSCKMLRPYLTPVTQPLIHREVCSMTPRGPQPWYQGRPLPGPAAFASGVTVPELRQELEKRLEATGVIRLFCVPHGSPRGVWLGPVC